MATVTINNSPIHSDSIITYPYGIADSGYSCGWHTGLDFAPYGTTVTNPLIYSVSNGTVVQVNLTPSASLGNNVIVQDTFGQYWRYCHMVTGSVQVSVGDTVTINSVIGTMGATGNVTGIHLHLEYSQTIAWQCSTFMNPATALGIPNVDNTIVKYDGGYVPPVTKTKKKKFPWFIYYRRFRNNY